MNKTDKRTLRLCELASTRAGFPVRSRVEHDPQGDMLIVQPANLSPWQSIDFDCLHRFNSQGKGAGYHSIGQGEILFYGRAGQKYAVLVDQAPPARTVAAGSLFVISVKNPDILPEYLTWYLNSRQALDYFQIMTGGSPQRVVTKTILDKLEIDLPGPDIQREIVEIWSLWLKEKELTSQMLDKKESLVLSGIDALKGNRT